MEDNFRWKWLLLLIVLVLALGGYMMYPPERKLKLGLDLRGGVSLVYEVDVTEDQDARQVVEQTIEVLKERVDPSGVMNLVWRHLQGNRFEVQMPAATETVTRQREAYHGKQEALIDGNIRKGRIQSDLRLEAGQRAGELNRLAGGNEKIGARLRALAETFDARAPLAQAADEAEQAHQELDQQLAELPAGTDPGVREQFEARSRAALDSSIEKATALNAGEKKLVEAWTEVLNFNIDPSAFANLLHLSNKPRRGSDGQTQPSPREAALDKLGQRHPDREAAIRKVAEAYAAYEAVKGPLDDANDLKAMLRGSGVLEYRIAPAPGKLANEAEFREQLRERGPTDDKTALYRWFPIDDLTSFTNTRQEIDLARQDPAGFFLGRNLIAEPFGDAIYLLLSNQPSETITKHFEEHRFWELASAYPTSDEMGFRAVGFELNSVGASLMGRLTSGHIGEPMAIVLDGRIKSAPTIQSMIGATGIITGGRGGFDLRESEFLIRTLNAGSLQAGVKGPIHEKTFNAKFGAANLQRGLKAATAAMIVVAVFMALYYLVNGLIANFALFANMVLILGIMSTDFLSGTFTLPGIAGIVLTIGMAVDANVLIFERIREELERGAEVRPAVRTGYGKALSTIIDANLTTLITCLVLGYTAPTEVQGFAVTLGIGILATLFTALLCTRVWIAIYLQFSGDRGLPMVPMLVPAIGKLLHPGVDWVGKRYGFFLISAALTIGGLGLVYSRGEDLLDIEFRSGTQVGFEIAAGKPAMEIRDVKDRLTKAAGQFGIPELSGDQIKVVATGETEGTGARSFTVATLADNTENRVTRAITRAFEDVLDVQPALSFAHEDERDAIGEWVVPIRTARLGPQIGRLDLTDEFGEYVGGVAILIEQLDPPATVENIHKRIVRTRFQPPHNEYGYRKYEVVGLEPARDDRPQDEMKTLYASVVILTHDEKTNYINDPETLENRNGLAFTEWSLARDALTRDTSLASVSSFSPQVSKTMKVDAVTAICLSLLFVVAYIWLRFGSLRYGLAAIVALIHDVSIALGMIALASTFAHTSLGRALLLSDFKIDLTIVAAMLTIVGYSLNDTIVVFDRIRENRGRLATATPAIINDSINQTFSRTVLTSLTTTLALLTLYIFGGEGVHGFAFGMLIGVAVGTYSSVAIAAPMVLVGAKKDGG